MTGRLEGKRALVTGAASTTIKGDYGLGRFENDGIGGKLPQDTIV